MSLLLYDLSTWFMILGSILCVTGEYIKGGILLSISMIAWLLYEYMIRKENRKLEGK